MDKVKIGIIGFGNMGSQHAGSLLKGQVPEAELAAVADIDPERMKKARDLSGGRFAVYESGDALIQSGSCEGVIIATPHYDHPSMAIAAMEAGIHVLVEKPAGVYTKQVEAMNETAKRHPDLIYCVDFNQRTNPMYQKLKELIESGELGKVKRVIWIITDWYRSQSYFDM